MNEALQLIAVALIVLACTWRAFRRYLPGHAWKLQARLSYSLETCKRSRALQRLGLWLRPVLPAIEAGCGSACSTCGGCATTPRAIGQIPLRLVGNR